MQILIVKLSSIGDVVHALPALAAMRRALPDARISWVVERGSAEILRGNPYLHRLVEVDTRGLRREKSLPNKLRSLRAQIAALRAEKSDVALDFQGLLKSALIAKLSGAKRRFGFDKNALREPASRFLLTETIAVPARVNIVEKNLLFAAGALQIPIPRSADDYEFVITTDAAHRREAENAMRRVSGDFAILNPGGGWQTKLWQPEKFAALADALWRRLKLKSIVTTGPNEEHLARAILNSARTPHIVGADVSLKGFYELAKRARVYVGADTGPMHLAVAANAPIVGIFGPTEWWRNGSPRTTDVGVERDDLSCRVDCHRRACGNWLCLDIEVERVLAAIEKRLEQPRREFGLEKITVG